jgi:hypothetical protein
MGAQTSILAIRHFCDAAAALLVEASQLPYLNLSRKGCGEQEYSGYSSFEVIVFHTNKKQQYKVKNDKHPAVKQEHY